MANEPISIEDCVAITNMMGRYQQTVDAGDEEEYAAFFTEDGSFLGLEAGPDIPSSIHGRENLKQVARITGSFDGKFRHFVGSFTVRYGDTQDEAYANYYVLACNWQMQGADRLAMFTLVETFLVRTGDGWKIKTQSMKNI